MTARAGSLVTAGSQAAEYAKLVWVSDDSAYAVIVAADHVAGCPRSKTRDTWQAASEADLIGGPGAVPLGKIGPGSMAKYILVPLLEHMRGMSKGKAPAKAATPDGPGDYPHKCGVCGGKMVILFSSTEHEGGACPGEAKRVSAR